MLTLCRWGCNNLNGNEAYQNHSDAHRDPLPGKLIWNPEVFFDVAVVNGNAWPEHQVRPNLYRLRLLNACDSRTLSLSAWAVPFGTNVTSFETLFEEGQELPIWIIGTEQSLLPDGPAKVLSTTNSTSNTTGSVEKFNCTVTDYVDSTQPHQGVIMQPGERYDALIDFADKDNYEVYLVNTAPDEPFKTFELVNAENRAPFETLGQLMKFNVSLEKDVNDTTTAPEELCFDNDPGGVTKFEQDEINTNRTVFLKEEVTCECNPFHVDYISDNTLYSPT